MNDGSWIASYVVFVSVVLVATFKPSSESSPIAIAGTCTTFGADCEFVFAGAAGENGALKVNDGNFDSDYFFSGPTGKTLATHINGQWKPSSSFGQFSLGIGQDRVRVNFESYDKTSQSGVFTLLKRTAEKNFVPFVTDTGAAVQGEYSVKSDQS